MSQTRLLGWAAMAYGLGMVFSWVLLLHLSAGAVDPAAMKLNTQGKQAFADRHYAEAATLFEALHEKTGLPEYLFNIATCYRLLGQCERARQFYLRYLAALPQASNRAVVEMHLENLSRCSQPATPSPVVNEADAGVAEARVVDAGVPSFEPVTATKPVELQVPAAPPLISPQGPSTRSVVGVTLAIAGGAAALTGGGLALKGWFDHQAAVVEPVALTAQREDQSSRTTWGWGLSVASAGLALLVAGLLAWLLP